VVKSGKIQAGEECGSGHFRRAAGEHLHMLEILLEIRGKKVFRVSLKLQT
jgi:hypothetical protein